MVIHWIMWVANFKELLCCDNASISSEVAKLRKKKKEDQFSNQSSKIVSKQSS